MHRDNLSTTIESSIGQGRLSGDAETVSDMARRYDGAINYWGQVWGNTNQVVVAINGFYFGPDVEPPGVPWSGQVHSGWYAKRFWELESSSGFAWKPPPGQADSLLHSWWRCDRLSDVRWHQRAA
jgi:hypothetical protein